ncbi:MAG: CPBP family intramembrane metalloprotease [Tannerellaceae bacterium]|nr:CPBP family intramembrane metalloprotease [Tannerellaceae bacterium]
MTSKGLFADKNGVSQVLILLIMILAGLAISTLFTSVIVLIRHGFTMDILENAGTLRFIQLFSVLGSFLFPALMGAWLFSHHPKQYLFLRPLPQPSVFLWVFLFMFLLSPTINLTALLNKEIILPSFMEGIERWMQTKEAEAERLTELLLAGSGIGTLLMNLLVVAVAAGVTEEFLFRGTLQRVFGKWTTNHHIIIWSVAFLFSAIHLQFYGFIPRMLLGAFFGYLLYWTNNIWVPVFAHFLNNAFGVIAMAREEWKNNEFINGEIPVDQLWLYGIWAVIALIILYFCLNKFRQSQQGSFPVSEDKTKEKV